MFCTGGMLILFSIVKNVPICGELLCWSFNMKKESNPNQPLIPASYSGVPFYVQQCGRRMRIPAIKKTQPLITELRTTPFRASNQVKQALMMRAADRIELLEAKVNQLEDKE